MNLVKKIFATIVFCVGFLSAPALAQEKPNIVLVFMDNFGWGEPGFNGGGIIRGAPTMLSEAGYATGMYGKWHLGRTKGRFPTDQGFDEWYGIPNTTDESVYSSLPGFAESGLSQTFVLDAKKGEAPRKAQPYNLDYRPLIDRDLTDRAIAFMKRQAESEKPFFIYLPYTATHFPTMPHPEFAGKSGKGVWGDMLMQIDSYIGELLDTMDDLGIARNTIFIFTADNGPEALEAGGTSLTVETAVHGSAGPWRGTLFTGFEGALRVPFAIRWPGRISPGTTSDEIVHAMDLFPTFAKLARGKVPDDRPIDGIDVSDFPPRENQEVRTRRICRLHGQRCLRREVERLEDSLQGAGCLEHHHAHLHHAKGL